jgi:hypothetical protein
MESMVEEAGPVAGVVVKRCKNKCVEAAVV